MYLFFEHVLVVLGVLAVATAIILALSQRRSPQSSAAWILFIILIPYLAVPVFVALGLGRWGHSFPPIKFLDTDPGDEPVYPVAAMLSRMGAPALCRGNRMQLLDGPDEAQRALESLIDGANHHLDIIFYILQNDATGRGFVRKLTEKADSGVRVRLKLDGFGSFLRPRRELAAFQRAGGELRILPMFRAFGRRGQINLRNHRKLAIADNRLVWAGGRNIANEYFHSTDGSWCDLGFTAEGPIVQPFADLFAADWSEVSPAPPVEPAILPASTADLQLVAAGPDEPLGILHDGLATLIHRAERRIWLASPYFVPTEYLELALITAAQRGVDVQIWLPDRANHLVTDLARGPYLRALEHAGCRIRRYHPGMLHAKAGIIDETGWIGSANFDVRSMKLNFELCLFLYDAGSMAALENWFHGITPYTTEGLAPVGMPRRFVEKIFRLGAPIL